VSKEVQFRVWGFITIVFIVISIIFLLTLFRNKDLFPAALYSEQ